MGKHTANECPYRQPRAPLSPPRNAKYCHICRRHGHDTDSCFFNARVTQPQAYPAQPYVSYPNQANPSTSYAPRPSNQGPNPTPVLPPQRPSYVQNYQPPNQARPSLPRNPIVPVAQVDYEHQGEDDLDDYVEGNHGDLVPMYYTTTKLQLDLLVG